MPPCGGTHAEEEKKGKKNIVTMTENIVHVKRDLLLTFLLPCGKNRGVVTGYPSQNDAHLSFAARHPNKMKPTYWRFAYYNR